MKFRNFVEASPFLRDIPEPERNGAADIIRSVFQHPVMGFAGIDEMLFRIWLKSYPDVDRDAVSLIEGTDAHDDAVQEMLAKELAGTRRLLALLSVSFPAARLSGIDERLFRESLRETGVIVEMVAVSPPRNMVEALLTVPYRGDIHVVSPQGEVWADRDGNVTALSARWREAPAYIPLPLKFDVAEADAFWDAQGFCLATDLDIRDVGFASDLGTIVPPDMEFRQGESEEAGYVSSPMRPGA